jgi:hypothetical protein
MYSVLRAKSAHCASFFSRQLSVVTQLTERMFNSGDISLSRQQGIVRVRCSFGKFGASNFAAHSSPHLKLQIRKHHGENPWKALGCSGLIPAKKGLEPHAD